MGCWNETCAVTHCPVFAGDDVVMLVYPIDRWKTASGALWREFDLVKRGKYNEYGWLEGVPEGDTNSFKDRSHEPYQRAVFVHIKAWKAAAAEGGKKPRTLKAELEQVMNFCGRNRLNPEAVLAFKGQQHADRKGYRAVIAMMQAQDAAWSGWDDSDPNGGFGDAG